LMEAVWTRYFPLSIYVRDVITSKKIGNVYRCQADNSIGSAPESFEKTHRMVNPDLAGGALLDLGIYSLTWVFQTLYTTQNESERQPPKVIGSAIKKFSTGVDEMTTALIVFPRDEKSGGDAHGIMTTTFRTSSDPDKKGSAGPAVRVQGDKGEVQVWFPPYRPSKTRLVLADGTVEDKDWPQPGPGEGSDWKNGFGDEFNAEGEGHGMFWEADEVAYALKEGRKEGKYESLAESIVIMEVMDEIRRQNNMTYPDKIESTDYPVQL